MTEKKLCVIKGKMKEVIIRNFNSCVKKNDTVYILGDTSHRIPVVEANNFYPVSIEYVKEFLGLGD